MVNHMEIGDALSSSHAVTLTAVDFNRTVGRSVNELVR
jgi:hypothetical protein